VVADAAQPANGADASARRAPAPLIDALADSVIVLPIQQDHLGQSHILLPPASFRPGVGQVTLDFPGGQRLARQKPEQTAIAILHRELGVEANAISQITPLNPDGWAINSSFSNQKLYGFIAHLEGDLLQPSGLRTISYPATKTGVRQLLDELTCLQCRAVLLEWCACLEKGLRLDDDQSMG
jgi:hypothetical protein